MFTFAAKPRILRLRDSAVVSLPSEVTLEAVLGPPWLFGMGGDFPKFVVAGSTGVIMNFNANTGRWHMKGGTQPDPVAASCNEPSGGTLQINGNKAFFKFTANTLEELSNVANAILYGLPMMLNAQLPFPCVVESLIGKTVEGEFGYEVARLEFHVPLVRQDDFNSQAAAALRYLTILGKQDHTRIHAGLAYFYRAVRLLEAGHTPWEFMAETVLNLAKSLEALFPPFGSTNTRDAIRNGLAVHGFTSADIETWFLPSLALRSHLDVVHVKLAMLAREQIEILSLYSENAVEHFRTLFQRVVEAALDDKSLVPVYAPSSVEGKALKSLTLLAKNLKRALPKTPAGTGTG